MAVASPGKRIKRVASAQLEAEIQRARKARELFKAIESFVQKDMAKNDEYIKDYSDYLEGDDLIPPPEIIPDMP